MSSPQGLHQELAHQLVAPTVHSCHTSVNLAWTTQRIHQAASAIQQSDNHFSAFLFIATNQPVFYFWHRPVQKRGPNFYFFFITTPWAQVTK
jgi:hypothetical protein